MRKLFAVFVLSLFGALGAAADEQKPTTMDQVIDRVIANEKHYNEEIRKYNPLVETYIQNLQADKALGYVPAGDRYFLGRAQFSKDLKLVSLSEHERRKGKKILGNVSGFFTFAMEFLPDGFLQMAFIDRNGLDRKNYKFDYVRREFLGEVRCLIFELTPLPHSGKGRFIGRIWVEDQDYNVVRFNGAYRGGSGASYFFHFDCWRTNLQPGLWLPSFIYSEERNLRYALAKKLDFKAQTRLWAYNVGRSSQEQELSKILVETPVTDESQSANDLSPVQAQRAWDRQAEDNLVERLQRIGLMAPRGEVDKVLDTVVNNLEVTNNLDLQPDARCRVMMTSSLESYTLGHTIVLSRGLIDVLPDEASLATVLAHELGHVILGHRFDPGYAFFDQLLVEDKKTFRHFGFGRTADEEKQASQKAIELLNNSPYKNQLGNAGLFLQAIEKRSKEIPNLISPHMGDRVPAISELKSTAAPNAAKNPQQIVALPLGGRVKLDSWNDKLYMIKTKPPGVITEREKMPFEVTPFMLYLTRYGSDSTKPTAAAGAVPDPPKNPQ
jgi:hypothetical protein